MISYTDMARIKTPRRAALAGLGCPCQELGDLRVGVTESETQRWLASLSPTVRATLEAQISSIIGGMSPASIEKVFPSIGLGFALDPGIATAISSLITTGASVYTTIDTNSTNLDITKAANSTQKAIAAANAAMSGQVNDSMSEAQIQANTLAASTTVKTSLIFGGIAALALISGTVIYLSRSRKK